MFNGIVYNVGKVEYLKKDSKNFYVGIRSKLNFNSRDIGSSVSCNGVCLTVTQIKKKLIFFYISKETLNRSNFKFLKIGDLINIEKSLIYGNKISGHFVQGHVDTVASVKKITFYGKAWLVKFSLVNKQLSKLLIEKGSISINGISLTISKVKNSFFETNIIPHTLMLTNLKNLKTKSVVNVELDIFAKYILKISK
ncbi:riboflavin synthase [Candidatus Pelagibacter bacterium]|nr:riboflavin synthase [Candidatus Pelagibacter bacterium]MDA9624862.1 riboflavin synthase [Candidatus Pelagibacter bacterium]